MGFSFIGTVKEARAKNLSVMLDTLTFDQLPKAVGDILDGIAEIKDICKELRGDNAAKDEFLTIEQLQAYHPDHPSLQTVHRWKSLGYIPFYKDPATRRVKFKKSDIDAWIASSRHMSRKEQNEFHDRQIIAKRNQQLTGGLDDE